MAKQEQDTAQVLSLVEYALRVLNREGVGARKYAAALSVWNYNEQVQAEEDSEGARHVNQEAV